MLPEAGENQRGVIEIEIESDNQDSAISFKYYYFLVY